MLKTVDLVIIGLMAAMVAALPHFRLISLFSYPLLVVMIGLLIFLLIPIVPKSLVTPRNGTRGWIDLGPMDFQPSELTKVIYVLVVARYLRWRSSHREFTGLIVPALITAVPLALITLQPDLGTASLFVPSLLAMLIAAGCRLRHIGIVCLAAVLAGPAAYPLLKPHQKTRIVGLIKQFQGDESSASDINFQAYTAQTLIGAGGVAGTGDERSRSLVHFNRLPERHNDTVFAVIVNRFGFFGGLVVLGLYGVWLLGAVLVSAGHREPQARLIGVGLAAFVLTQVVVNAGMNMGVLPIIGITLPFLSYGGSSLVTMWLMTGLVMNVGLHPARPPYRQSFEYDDGDDEWARLGTRPYGKSIGFSGRALSR